MRTSGGNQQDPVVALVKQLIQIDQARNKLESLIISISLASAINLDRNIDDINEEAAKKNLDIRDRALALSKAEDKLAEMLKSNKALHEAYKKLENNSEFTLDQNASTKEKMLREELKKAGVVMQPQSQQTAVKASTPPARSVLPPPSRPVKSASAPAQMMSEEERQFRIDFLAVKHFCSNKYYNLMQYEQVGRKIDDIENSILKYERVDKDILAIRKELCEVLNGIIGNQKPTTGILKSKHEKMYDKRLTKIAMCIQQLGGVVENKEYGALADKAFQKKKIEPEKVFKEGEFRSQAQQPLTRKNSLTK